VKLNGDEIGSNRVISHAGITAKISVPFGFHPCDTGCGMPNALFQLQAHYHRCGEAASENSLAAATFVRPRAVTHNSTRDFALRN
jgi:hypothetical protein